MRLITFGAGAALATLSQAFLLPPTISKSNGDIVNALPFDAAIQADGRMLAVDCPGCPISAQDIQGGRHDLKGLNRLMFNFSVSHDNGLDRVLLNGLQFYPIDLESNLGRLTAPQMIKTSENTWVEAAQPDLGYALRIHEPISYTTQDEINLVIANLDIIEVGNKFVDTVDSIELKILTTPSGKMMIGDAKVTPPPPKSHLSDPTDDGQECTTMLCKWRAIIEDKLSALKKGCGGKGPAASHSRPQGNGRPHPHGHHGGHDDNGRHGGHGRPHRFSHKHHGITRFLRGVVLHVVIPVTIGIVAGITASLVGMIVGHVVIFMWRLLFRRGSQGSYTKVQQEDVVVEDGIEENKSSIQHQGPPPVYEDIVREDKA
ncbi:hypothetical protein NHQ30_001850 [Ciborinia camelliae]|nr:hypothetical protein NHQ30_001850 [Ciborinia camelliae]